MVSFASVFTRVRDTKLDPGSLNAATKYASTQEDQIFESQVL